MACGPPGTLAWLSRRAYGSFPRAGMERVQGRATCLARPARYPFRRWPIESAQAIRPRFLEWELVSASELDDWLSECDQMAAGRRIPGIHTRAANAGAAPPHGHGAAPFAAGAWSDRICDIIRSSNYLAV